MSQELADSVDVLTAQTTALLQEYITANTTLQNSATDAADSAAEALASQQSAGNDAVTATAKAAEAEQSAANAAAVVTGGTATLTPEAGKIPLADANGKLNIEWLKLDALAKPEPDFHAPLNDSLQIVRGFGTHDTIDVSPAQDGSVMVELPTKSIDFSCAAQRNFFNKSGQKQIADFDRPAIDNDGVLFHQSYIAAGINSERIFDSETESNFSGWSYSDGLSVVPSIDGGPKIYQQIYSSEGSNNVPSPTVTFATLGVSTGDKITCSVYLRGTPGATCRLQAFVYSPTLAISPIDITVNDEFQRYQLTFIVPDASIYSYFKFQPVRLGTGNIKDGDIIQFHSPMVTAGSLALPYIETQGSAIAVPATVASVPLMNNMPEPGKSFSISVKADIPNIKAAVFGFGQVLPERFTLWRFDANDPVRIRINDGTQTLSISSGSLNTRKRCEYSIVFDADTQTLSLYIDKQLVGSVDVSTVDWSQVYSPQSTGYVGRLAAASASLNGVLADLKIYHYALSAEQIKAGV